MNSPPAVFDTFEKTLGEVLSGFQIRREYWVHASKMINRMLYQKRISEFI
jgi:hypothetical protein